MNAFQRLLLGTSPAFQGVLRAAGLVAAADVTVLLRGESGTGKELFARAIHEESPRKEGPLVAINCAALPESLAEAELFGHAKGAFTGAVGRSEGRIQAAHGGTLFLDEVGELAPVVQGKLLRFLETGECQGVGEGRTRRVSVRVVAATNRDLEAMVREGSFREDLYYRLNVVPLELPPLRERHGDVAVLMTHFSRTLAALHGRPAPRFSKAARQRLENHVWPGNVRELRNLCERLVVLMADREVLPEHLPQELHPARHAQQGAGHGGFMLPEEGIDFRQLEVQMIRQALTKSGGNQTRAARLLGLTRDTLLYRIRKYAI